MKLELKHLAPYLPYSLKLLVVRKTFGINTENIVEEWKPTDIAQPFVKRYKVKSVKPVLHPLYEYCGKIIAGNVMKKLNCSLGVVYELWAFDSGEKTLNELSYETYETMCKNHIDFNKLIENNLAIDINTL